MSKDVLGLDITDSDSRLPTYADQIFLVDFLPFIEGLKGKTLKQDFKHFSMIKQERNSNFFLNQITGISGGQSLLEKVPRSILGDLQPYFKLYLTRGMTKESYKEYRLPLNNFVNLDPEGAATKPGLGATLKQFSWDYLGTHPGDIDYWINCDMKLYFESSKALFNKYKESGGESYSFASLLYRRGKKDASKNLEKGSSAQGAHRRYNQKDHRIKVEIGYIPPSMNRLIEAFAEQGMHSNAKLAAVSFRNALRRNKVVLYLTLTKHTFVPIFSSTDFSFELDIKFVGSIEQAFLSDDANILVRDKGQEKHRRSLLEAQATEAKVAVMQTNFLTKKQLKRVEEDLMNVNDLIANLSEPQEQVAALQNALEAEGFVDQAQLHRD